MRSFYSRLKRLENVVPQRDRWVIIGVGYWSCEQPYEAAKQEAINLYFQKHPELLDRVKFVILQGKQKGILKEFYL